MARRSDHSREELHKLVLVACREIVRENGLSELKMRRVAERIGYTAGTLYQVFNNLDDMVEQLNTMTLQQLFEHCSEFPRSDEPAQNLKTLARRFSDYVHTQKNLWEAVMLHRFPPEQVRSPEYEQKVLQLLGLITASTAPYYTEAEKEAQIHDARVLWSCLYGIYALDASNRHAKSESVEAMTDSVVDFFVAAKTGVNVNRP